MDMGFEKSLIKKIGWRWVFLNRIGSWPRPAVGEKYNWEF
jgi:hypothetical protein